jgi:hypothetical protein
MLPQFTAESALPRSDRNYQGRSRPALDVGAVPQALELRGRGMIADVRGGDNAAAVTTCTCPCCQVVNGRLVCC